jgi:hypothetical protein
MLSSTSLTGAFEGAGLVLLDDLCREAGLARARALVRAEAEGLGDAA